MAVSARSRCPAWSPPRHRPLWSRLTVTSSGAGRPTGPATSASGPTAPAFTVDAYPPTNLRYSGAWAARTVPSAWYRATWASIDPAASATAEVTGQELAVVGPTRPDGPAVQIYVDGQLRLTVAARSLVPSSRRILGRLPMAAGSHLVRIQRAPGETAPL